MNNIRLFLLCNQRRSFYRDPGTEKMTRLLFSLNRYAVIAFGRYLFYNISVIPIAADTGISV
jgi:hypothetical protein